MFALLSQILGGLRVTVLCADGETRMALIPGKMRRRQWVREGDLIIVWPWDFHDSKADVKHRYTKTQAMYLSRKGVLPDDVDMFGMGVSLDDDGEHDDLFASGNAVDDEPEAEPEAEAEGGDDGDDLFADDGDDDLFADDEDDDLFAEEEPAEENPPAADSVVEDEPEGDDDDDEDIDALFG